MKRSGFIALFALTFLGEVRAQETGCESRDLTIIRTVRSQVDALKNKTVSVENFLKALPGVFHENFILMASSESRQAADPTHPRVLLVSPNDEMVVSFSTNPKAEGYFRVEIIFWNAEKGDFDLLDVDFSKPAIVSEMNPRSCATCHIGGGPIWDPKVFWAGALPSRQDRLLKDSKEVDWYLDLLGRAEKKEGRLGILKFPAAAQSIRKALEADGFWIHLPHSQSGSGVSLKLFDRLVSLRRCKIEKDLRSLVDFQKIRFAISAAANYCDGIEAFFPKNVAGRFDAFHAARGVVPGAGQTTLQALEADTKQKNEEFLAARTGRQAAIFRDAFGTEAAKSEMAIQVPNTLERPAQIANLRYFLEPLGVRMNEWSISRDRLSYTFAAGLFLVPWTTDRELTDEFLGQVNGPKAPSFEASLYLQENRSTFCAWLQKRSLEAFQKPKEDLAFVPCRPTQETLDPQNLQRIGSLQREVLKTAVKGALVNADCMGCHQTQRKGAPLIPFHDISALEKLIRDDFLLPGRGIGPRIVDRAFRHSDEPGAMPPDAAMPASDRAILRTWIEGLQ